jgi:hypothetical protein
MPMWMLAAASARPGTSRSRPRGAPAADEDRVEPLPKQRAHAVDALAGTEFHAEVEHIAHLLVDHALRQTELGNLRAHHAAGLGVAVEHDELVAEGCQVSRNGERRRSCADECDALAVLLRSRLGQELADVFLESAATRFRRQIATGSGFAFLSPPSSTRPRRHAGSQGGRRCARESGEDVRLPVDEIRVAIAAGGDEPDVLGNRGVGGHAHWQSTTL